MDEYQYVHLHIGNWEIFEGMVPVQSMLLFKSAGIMLLFSLAAFSLEWRVLREKYGRKKKDKK